MPRITGNIIPTAGHSRFVQEGQVYSAGGSIHQLDLSYSFSIRLTFSMKFPSLRPLFLDDLTIFHFNDSLGPVSKLQVMCHNE
jgi:hypothetical protein